MSNLEGSIASLGDGAFRILRSDGSQVLAYGVVDRTKTWVFLDGVTYVIEPSRRTATGASADAALLAAPMPATVTQIHVDVGQSVAPADLLVTLEAMKMELPIRATTSGTVTAINCRIGELVQPGVALVDVRKAETDNAPGTRGPHKARATDEGGRTPNPEPRTPNPEPRTLNPEPNAEPRS